MLDTAITPQDGHRPGRVLVVDHDRVLRETLRSDLAAAGYEVDCADSGQDGLRRVAASRPDGVVIEVGGPDPDGMEVCRRLRVSGYRLPIMMLTPSTAVGERIEGLDAGADDCLVKPFDVEELKARLRALLRRSATEAGLAPVRFEELRLDPDRHGVVVGSHLVALTPIELDVLRLLMLNPRRVLTNATIFDRVWGYDLGPESNALRVYIRYLRRKLGAAGARPLIHTVRGVGYVLREP